MERLIKVKYLLTYDVTSVYLRVGYSNNNNLLDTLDTPMRELIRKFPEMAKKVLDKCVKAEENNQKKVKIYNCEFLEDTFKYKHIGKDDFRHVR